MAINREELAKQFGSSDKPKKTEQPKVAKLDRSQISDSLFGGQSGQQVRENLFGQTSQPRKVSFTKPVAPIVTPEWEQKKGGGGFLGFLGDVIDIIDTPRAAIVSTVKETGDLLRGDGFSFGDWWNQTSDNMMMGEVFRDWGVDLPGPLDFIVGIGFDIALDPLTYLTGGAAAARQLTGRQVATALTRASKAADKANDAVNAKRYADAAARVSTRGILSAGDDVLRDIGLSAGLGMTIPGTGRLGKRIIEAPLRRGSKGLGQRLDMRRVQQLPEVQVAKQKGRFNPWPSSEVVTNLGTREVQEAIVDTMRKIRAGESVSDVSKYESLARRALNAPVQFGQNVNYRIPGTGKFVSVVAGTPGRAVNTIAATNVGRYIAKYMSPEAGLNQAVRDSGKKLLNATDDNARQLALDELTSVTKLSHARDEAVIKIGIAEHKGLDMLGVLRASADDLGVDFDQLMLLAAEQPKSVVGVAGLPDQFATPNAALRDLDPRYIDDPKVAALHDAAQTFWAELGGQYNKILGDVGVDFDLIKDEFYVARMLGKDAPRNVARDAVISGSPTNRRTYRTPKGIKKIRNDGDISDQSIIDAAKEARVSTVNADGIPRTIDEIFNDVLNAGGKFTLNNGESVTNRYMNTALKDVQGTGGIRGQMIDIGEKQLGAKYYDQFSTNAGDVIAKYMSAMNNHVRIQYMLGYMDNIGVTAVGVNGRVFAQAADDAARTANRNLKTLNERWEPQVARKVTQQEKIERIAMRQAVMEERIFAVQQAMGDVAGPVDVSRLPKYVQDELVKMQNLNAKIADAEAIRDNIRSVARRIIEGDVNAVDELSPAAFDLLTSASTSASRRKVADVGKAITQEAQEEATQFIYNMGERVQALNDVRNKVLEIFNAGDELTNSAAKVLLDDIDGVIRESEEILRSLNKNYLDSMFQDPTVIGAQKLDDLVDAFSESFLGRGSKVIDPFGNVTPNQKLDDLLKEVKRLYRREGRRKGVPYEAVKRYDKFFDDLKAYKKLADDLDPEVLYASTIAQAVRNLPEAQTAINDLAGINVIADEIARVKASLEKARGVEYRGLHTAPERGFEGVGETLDDLSNVMPDAAGPRGIDYYGQRSPEFAQVNKEMQEALARATGNPDAEIVIYRAVPKGVNEINPGDWITPSRSYADMHGASWIEGEYEIIQSTVRAGDLVNNGDSLYEFGYVPVQAEIVKSLTQRLSVLEARAAAQEALIQPYREAIEDLYTNIAGPAQRRIDELAAQGVAPQAIIDDIDTQFNLQFSRIEMQKLAMDLKLAQQAKNDPFLTNRLAAIKSQEEAIANINTVRGQNMLSDLYADAQGDFLKTELGSQNVLQQTNNALRGRTLFNATEEFAETYANAFQSIARIQDPKVMGDFMQKYSKFLNYWKAQAVSTPGFFMRNMLGGAWINSALNNVPMATHQRVWEIRKAAIKKAKDLGTDIDNPNDILRGLDQLIADNKSIRLGVKAGKQTVGVDELKTFREWYETGMAGQGQVSQEITSALDMLGRQNQRFAGSFNPFKTDFKGFALIRRRNQDVEFMLRGAMAHHTMMAGRNVDDAYRNVIKFHFDYSDLTNAERSVKKVIPFWVWQKNVLPVLIESMGKKPAAWGRLLQVKKEMELTSPMEGIVPEYFGENMGIRMPFKMGGNRVYVLPDLPFRDLAKFTKDVENPLDVKQVGKNVYRVARESALPPIKFPIEHWAGKQTFADIPLTGRFQQAPSWANLPGLKQALLATGLAKQSNISGRLVMTDKNIYGFDQFMPMFGRLRRFVPNERKKQEAFWTTAINTTFGTGLRVNTPSEVRAQIFRQQRKWADDWRNMKDIEFRTR